VHRERVSALLGEERCVYAADAGGVVYERIDAKRRVAADVFGGERGCCVEVLRC
jgi:hypothetical protein